MLYHILAVGDVVGEEGLRHLSRHLRQIKKLKNIAFAVVNGPTGFLGASALTN